MSLQGGRGEQRRYLVTEVVVTVAVVVLFGEGAGVFGGVRIVGCGGGQVLQVGEAVVGTGGVDGVAVFVKERAGVAVLAQAVF